MVLQDLQQVAALIILQLLRAPVIDDQQLDPSQGLQHAGVAPFAAGQRQIGEQPWRAVKGARDVLSAGLLPERTSQPALADAGRSRQQKPLAGAYPLAAGELEEQGAVQPPGGAVVHVLYAGGVAKPRGAGPAFEALLAALGRLVVQQQGQPFGMLQGAGFGLDGHVVEGFGHSVQAELDQAVAGGMGQHGVPQWKVGPRTLGVVDDGARSGVAAQG